MIILLVEDNQQIRESIKAFLSYLGHQVVESGNGRDALLYLKKNPVHLVLSDIQMPYMDGYDLLKAIKGDKNIEEVQVILFTGHGDLKRAVTAMKDGAYDYLLKPIDINELKQIIDRVSEYLDLKQENKKLTREFKEQVKQATSEIEKELTEVRKALIQVIGTADIGIFSDSLKKVFATAEKLHRNPDIPVLLEGETGTGKEMVAKFIHYGNGDIITPFIALNCAAINSGLFESELFGYESGAFTGGNPKGQKGKLELTGEGTILLDEITEMPVEHQAKLLRVIQEKEYYKVGGLKKLNCNARIICSTNRNVQEQVKEGTFREDLFFRLNVGYVRIPPLRERKEEIIPLAQMFLDQLLIVNKTSFKSISHDAEKRLINYNWPGNVRELKSTIERIALLWEDSVIDIKHLDNLLKGSIVKAEPLLDNNSFEQFNLPEERLDINQYTLNIIRMAMERFNQNKTKTASYLGISLRVLHTYLKRLEN
ncbi:MAG TPA: sigma-54 dependent transcriptional regulator [bacterium]|nr:sigma-54 dependent transcriptional regulator [bacterium]HPN42986.1 sigma-54 dependent transcriptional regulator [bacterium]